MNSVNIEFQLPKKADSQADNEALTRALTQAQNQALTQAQTQAQTRALTQNVGQTNTNTFSLDPFIAAIRDGNTFLANQLFASLSAQVLTGLNSNDFTSDIDWASMAALLAQYATNMTPTPQNAKMLNKLTRSLPIVNLANAKSLMSKLLDAINSGDDLLANSLMSTLTLAVLNSGSTDPSWIALSDQLKSYQSLFELDPSNIFLAEQWASTRKDCIMSPWSAWSSCDAKGTQTQTRSIVSPSENGGSPCLSLVQSSNCPVQCSVGPWSSFGECSQPCGGGTRSQSRNILVPALFGGTECPSLSNVQACNSNACPVDCRVGPWSSWSSCDKTGNMTRDRSVIAKDLYGGAACPTLRESSNCPVACEVSDWSTFDSCTKACGGGLQSQTRTIKTNTLFGGTPCPPLRNEQACNSNLCPLSCVTSEWSSWSPCSNGITRRSMSVITPAAYGGSCPDPSTMVQSSNCPLDCVVGPWTTWSACASNGLLNRTRLITVQPLYGGAACPPLTGSSNCPVDCVVGDWSTCTASCGGGTQTRVIVTQAAYGGLACPTLTQACNTQACPVPCVGSWSGWSACSSTCGGGKQTQTYTVSVPSAYGGTECPSSNNSMNTQVCNAQACPALYAFTSFTFTSCGANGAYGPTSAQMTSAYNSTAWAQVASNLSMVVQGIQRWTVPTTASFTITVAGACGGTHTGSGYICNPGQGVIIRSTFDLTKGTILLILVGQKGTNVSGTYGGAGGGGGTFVATSTTALLIGAGGGAGSGGGSGPNNGQNGLTSTDGGAGVPYSGTCHGNVGGTVGSRGARSTKYSQRQCPGAGFLSSPWIWEGDLGALSAPFCFAEGGAGGTTNTGSYGSGGFGGGGAGSERKGGTAGGYSGGGGVSTEGQAEAYGSGGGGGSYSSVALSSQGLNTGNGYVTITM